MVCEIPSKGISNYFTLIWAVISHDAIESTTTTRILSYYYYSPCHPDSADFKSTPTVNNIILHSQTDKSIIIIINRDSHYLLFISRFDV